MNVLTYGKIYADHDDLRAGGQRTQDSLAGFKESKKDQGN